MKGIFGLCAVLSALAFGCAAESESDDVNVAVREGTLGQKSIDTGCRTTAQRLPVDARTAAFFDALQTIAADGASAVVPSGPGAPWGALPYAANIDTVLQRLVTGAGGSTVAIGGAASVAVVACGEETTVPSTKVMVTGTAKSLLDTMVSRGAFGADFDVWIAPDVPDNGARWTTYAIAD